jgi:ATP/maltotriose-dependent transcriptional regulator MalT
LILFLRGTAALEQGDVDRAQALVADALAQYRQVGFPFGMARTLHTLGSIEADRGETAGAAARYPESLRLWSEIGNLEGLVDTVAATGTLAVAVDRPDVATRLLGAAAALADSLGYLARPPDQARRADAIAAARTALGETAFAMAWEAGRALGPEAVTAEALAVLTELAAPRQSNSGQDPASRAGLTPREREVLVLIADGLSDREVAAALFVGPGTVRSHLTSLYGKLGVGSRTAAVATARGLGIL